MVGASRGIGFELARQLAESPDVERVIAAARTPYDSEGLSALLAYRGDKVSGVSIDVTDERSVIAAAQEISRSVARLDLVVNCAGLLHDGPRLSID